MTFNKALQKNKKILKGMKSNNGKLVNDKNNQLMVREYILRSLSDSGHIALEILLETFWIIKQDLPFIVLIFQRANVSINEGQTGKTSKNIPIRMPYNARFEVK